MAVSRVKLTYQDYLELPDDGKQYQIIEGDLVVTPAPGRPHQGTCGNLYSILRPHILGDALGELYFAPFDVILDESTIVQPDLLFIDHERIPMLTDRGMNGPPTLVVEILSPSSNRIDRVRKLQIYARFGVPHYWIVDPHSRYIEAYELAGETYELTGYLQGTASGSLPPFPDLEIRLVDVWS
jgi:Uma2 family endonuclease